MRAARRDDNEQEIVNALRKAGAYVEYMHNFDLLVAFRGQWHRLEVKDGNKPPSKQKLTKHEQKLIKELGDRAPVHIVNSIESALKAIGGIKQ